jgi:hypothetical protein
MTDWEFEESKKELEGFKERLKYIQRIYDFYYNQPDKQYDRKSYADVKKEYELEERILKHKIELFELGHKYEEELRRKSKTIKQDLDEKWESEYFHLQADYEGLQFEYEKLEENFKTIVSEYKEAIKYINLALMEIDHDQMECFKVYSKRKVLKILEEMDFED